MEPSGQRILLVYLFSALGDAALLAPVASALVAAGARVDLLLREAGARLFRHIDLPVRVHTLPEALAVTPEPDDDEARAAAVRLSVALKRRRFHAAVDLTARRDVDGRRWVERSEAPHSFGFATGDDRSMSWVAEDERVEALEHWTRYLAAPLAPFGPLSLPAEVPFLVPAPAEEKAELLWGQKSPRVLLVPGSRNPDKRFSSEAFRAAGRLAAARGASVVVAGGPGEKALLREVAAGGPIYAGKSLGPLVALATSADVVVTNDTGPMHLALLSGRCTIAVFTTMQPTCWGPMRADPRFVVLRQPPGADRSVVGRMVLDHLDAQLARIAR